MMSTQKVGTLVPLYDGNLVPAAERLWIVYVTPLQALRILADFDHTIPSPAMRPQFGAAWQDDGSVALVMRQRYTSFGTMVMLLTRYATVGTIKSWEVLGTAWVAGDQLVARLAEEAAHALA